MDILAPRDAMPTDLPLLKDAALLGAVLDAYPAPSFVVDDDVRALFINAAARKLLGLEGEGVQRALLKRAGHVLHCFHATETPEGCGRAPACRSCVIRNSVGTALTTAAVHRARAFLQLETAAGLLDAHFLVSAAPVPAGDRTLVVLTLEDLSDVVKLTSLLPICFHCRKVRDEHDYWQTIEAYFKERADIDFSHALCEECLDKHYPEHDGSRPSDG